MAEQIKNLIGNATQRYERSKPNYTPKPRKRRTDLQSKFTESQESAGTSAHDSGVDTSAAGASSLRLPLFPRLSGSDSDSN